MPRYLLVVSSAGELDGEYTRFGKDADEATERLRLDLEEVGTRAEIVAREMFNKEENGQQEDARDA